MKTREIKFRGMTIEGEWVYGFVRENTNPNMQYRGWFIADSMHSPLSFEVRPETIGQFTGLKDKNKKDVFDGDILSIGIKDANGKVWMNREAVIIWNEYGFCLDYTKSRIERDKEVGICDINENRKEFEVIGNVYQTPYLIK